VQESVAFPGFTAQVFGQYLKRSRAEGHTTTTKEFRQMLRARASS
jgi:O-acetyl-ADP-ribose deacetylase (regulator of RNase III)